MNDARLSEYLDQMRRAATDARSYVEGMSKIEFLADRRTQEATIMNLIILGEAATKVMDLYSEFAAGHPQVAWRGMRGMRNRIAHGYCEIDLDVVWDTIQAALPPLLLSLDVRPGV